jgi:hypothetical protein
MWVVNSDEELQELKTQFGDDLMGVMSDKPTMLQ